MQDKNQAEHHIQCRSGDIGRYVLLPGDPGRCASIAGYFDNPRQIAVSREYTTYTGTLEGEKVSVMSTGIGGASTAIAVEELVNIGADTLIRVGTCGGMSLDVQINDVVIASGAIRFDGTSKEYMPLEFPAVADFTVLKALEGSARQLDIPYHVGIVHCKDSFYGQHEPEAKPLRYDLLNKWQAWLEGGTLASEMESSTLFVLGSILKVRTGTVLAVAGNQERRRNNLANELFTGPDRAIRVAIDTLRQLIKEQKDVEGR